MSTEDTASGSRSQTLISVTVVLLTVVGDGQRRTLKVLVVRPDDHGAADRWTLPGDALREGEDLDAAAARVLVDLAHVDTLGTEQLHAFSRADPGATAAVNVAYFALVDGARLEAADIDEGVDLLRVVSQEVEQVDLMDPRGHRVVLGRDQQQMVLMAIARIRAKLEYDNVGFEFLPEKFTLLDLRRVHEAIQGKELNKDAFRQKVLMKQLVSPTGELASGGRHRPPQLYRVAANNLQKER